MKAALPNALARALRGFFVEYLPAVRGASPHTVRSYRDTLVLLLRFLAARTGRSVADLDLDDLDYDHVLAFLEYLEGDRHNVTSTRNVRLAAVHAFARYVAGQHPGALQTCQRLLALPFKRAHQRQVEYLEATEMQALLAATDRHTADGRRDHAMLLLLYNTGARVQELLDIRPRDIQLVRPASVRLSGKGRKERLCPLWPQTIEVLTALLAQTGLETTSGEKLFRNRGGQPLTRFGVRYLLRKYVVAAHPVAPGLARKRVHPHTLRHTTAVHLLQAGVDLVSIGHWLGHATVDTTNRYAAIDLDAKRKAIDSIGPIAEGAPSHARWQTDASLLRWLEAL